MRSAGAPPWTQRAPLPFADIAGYTALTQAHGDEQATDLVAKFFAGHRAHRVLQHFKDVLRQHLPDDSLDISSTTLAPPCTARSRRPPRPSSSPLRDSRNGRVIGREVQTCIRYRTGILEPTLNSPGLRG
jgi:hypothetical protein